MKYLLLLLIVANSALAGNEPPFSAYVRDTTDFKWKKQESTVAGKFQLEVTSQNWHGAVWTHTVNVIRPAKSIAPDLAVIFVNGGENLPQIAAQTGVACVSVGGIYPACHGQNGGEGIAIYALQQSAKTGDPTWSISAATTKALVRTMDALAASGEFKRFILTGFSKMGLASWWAAVMDERVVGIIPVGADLLNTAAQINSHPNLLPQLGANGATALEWVDPYLYRDKLRAAKLVISGTNDEHFDVSSVAAFWDGLPEPKRHLHLANATHSLEPNNPRSIAASVAFIRTLAAGETLPRIESEVSGTTLKVTSNPAAKSARLWTAAPTGEFKFAKWSDTPMAPASGAAFTGEFAKSTNGRVAVFAELEFDGYSLTTGIYVSP